MANLTGRKHTDQTKTNETQIPMFTPESDWRPPRLGELPEWPTNASARVAIDVETKDPDIKKMGCGARRADTMLVGYSFRIENGPGFYVPLRHQGGDNVENPEMALAYLEAQSRAFRGQIVGCNLGYDADWLAQEGIDFIGSPCVWRDIGVAEPLLDELQFNYGLEAISDRYGRPGKREALLKDAAEHFGVHPKAGLWKLPARFVGPYGLGDVDEPLAILRLQEKRIEEAGIWDIFNLECEVQPILTLMRRRGVRIDMDRLAQVEAWSRGEESAALDEIHRLTGVRIGLGKGIMAASAVAPALESIGVTLKKTAKVMLTTDSEYVMKGIREWMPNWKKRGWKTASKQPVKNADLWMQLDELVNQHEVEWRWVKGHSGHRENDIADELANLGVQEVLNKGTKTHA